MNVLLNFFAANACFLLPLWWMFIGWMPDQMKIYMRGQEAPGAIVARGLSLVGEDWGAWQGGRIYRFYLRGGMRWKELAFRLPGEAGPKAVARIELQKGKLLALGKSGCGLTSSGKRADEYVFQNPRFESWGLVPGKISCGLGAFEVLLMGISWWCAKRHQAEAWKALYPSVVGVALVLTMLMQVALPVQSFFANRSAYAFSAGELWRAIAGRFAWTSVFAVAAVGLLTRCFGRWVLGVVFAFAVCVYLESGILSHGLAKLNGDIWLLQNPTRALWDAAVWAGVFAGVAALHGVFRKRYELVSMCLAAMVASSMLDIKREEGADKSKLVVGDFVSYETVIQSVAYSTNRNVLVFILDSMEREQAHAVMEDPEVGAALREKFRGFTEYTNNVGALPATVTAVPNLLTGRYPDNTISSAEYSWLCYGKDSALQTFLGAGHDAFVITPGLGFGYASKRGETSGNLGGVPVLKRAGNDGETWSVSDFSRWRWMPFAAKAPCSGLIGMGNEGAVLREWGMYPSLAQAGFDDNSPGVFMLVHTEGVHVPIMLNRSGEMLPVAGQSDRSRLEQGVFVLGCLAELMEAYRRIGIYDNTLILALGDHGRGSVDGMIRDKTNGRLPDNARPFLWVKPMGSQHDFTTSPLPTSHARVAEVLKASVSEVLSEPEIQTLLQTNRRVYRQMSFLGGGWTDWVVDQDGTFEVQENCGSGVGTKKRRPLLCGQRYSLGWRETRNTDVDMAFIGTDAGGGPYLLRGSRRLRIEFRVPNAGKTYTLKFELYDGEGGALRFRCESAGTETWTEFPVRPHGVIVLRHLKGDEDGMVTIVCERGGGPEVDVAFTSALLEEEK